MAPPIRPTRLAVDRIDHTISLVPYTELEIVSTSGDFVPGLAITTRKFALTVQGGTEIKRTVTKAQVDEVPREAMDLTRGRFQYAFVKSSIVAANLAKVADPDFWSRVHTGRPFDEIEKTPFILTGLHFVTADGAYESAFAETVLQSAQAKTAPPTQAPNPTASMVLFTNAESFVVGSGIPLRLDVIQGFEKDGAPDPFPVFPTTAIFPILQLGPDVFRFAFPSIDPVVMTQALTQKYHFACDLYLAHAQDFEHPPVLRDEEPEVALGYRNYLKNNLAHAFKQLLKAVPKIASAVREGGKAHENFIKSYQENIDFLLKERDEKAKELVTWLESPFLKEVELWFRTDKTLDQMQVGGQAVVTTSEYVQALSLATSRLSECEPGAAYLLRLLEEAKGDSPPTGVARVVAEFMLPDENLGPEWTQVSQSASLGIISAWAAFANVVAMNTANGQALDFIRKRSTSGEAALNDVIEVLARFPNSAFGQALIHLKGVRESELDGSLVEFSERLRSRLDRPLRLGGLFDTMKEFAPGEQPTAGKLAPDSLGIMLAAVNSVIKVASLIEEAKKNETGASLNEATLGALEGLVTLSDEIGKLAVARTAASNAFSHSLGLIASGLSILAAANGARDKWEKHDWDAMAAKLAEGVGAGLTAYGIYLMATAPATGPTPAAGFLFFGGAILGVGGAVWGLFAADVPYEQLLKFSFFGTESAANVKAPIWALCDNFSEWNPDTEAGLKLQLRAAEQLLHGFTVKGITPTGGQVLAANGAIQITPASVIDGSTFHIEYTVQYQPFSGVIQKPITGYCRVDIHKAPTSSALAGTMTNPEKTFAEANAVVVRSDGTRTVIEVRFFKNPPLSEGSAPLELHTLACKVRLDVHGDGTDAAHGADAALVVPNSKNGPRFVAGTVFEGRSLRGDEFKSYDATP